MSGNGVSDRGALILVYPHGTVSIPCEGAWYTGGMDVLIATFSQFGTTETIGDEIGQGLISGGATVDYARIGGDPVPDLRNYDLIGIGTPAGGSDGDGEWRAPHTISPGL